MPSNNKPSLGPSPSPSQRKRRSQIDKEILTLQQRILTLSSERNTLAPIHHHLPQPLLLLIFALLSSRSAEPAFVDLLTVTWVCRHWRTLALSEPALWARVHLPRDPRHVECALQRSSGAGLAVEAIDKPGRYTLQQLTRQLRPQTARVKSLRLSSPRDLLDGRYLLDQHDFSSLQHLTLTNVDLEDLSCARLAPRLLSLRVEGCAHTWGNPATIPPTLRSLAIIRPTPLLDLTALLPLLARLAKTLEHLELGECHVVSTSEPLRPSAAATAVPPLVLGRLRTLVLRGKAAWLFRLLPRLELPIQTAYTLQPTDAGYDLQALVRHLRKTQSQTYPIVQLEAATPDPALRAQGIAPSIAFWRRQPLGSGKTELVKSEISLPRIQQPQQQQVSVGGGWGGGGGIDRSWTTLQQLSFESLEYLHLDGPHFDATATPHLPLGVDTSGGELYTSWLDTFGELPSLYALYLSPPFTTLFFQLVLREHATLLPKLRKEGAIGLLPPIPIEPGLNLSGHGHGHGHEYEYGVVLRRGAGEGRHKRQEHKRQEEKEEEQRVKRIEGELRARKLGLKFCALRRLELRSAEATASRGDSGTGDGERGARRNLPPPPPPSSSSFPSSSSSSSTSSRRTLSLNQMQPRNRIGGGSGGGGNGSSGGEQMHLGKLADILQVRREIGVGLELLCYHGFSRVVEEEEEEHYRRRLARWVGRVCEGSEREGHEPVWTAGGYHRVYR